VTSSDKHQAIISTYIGTHISKVHYPGLN
jgi:hypothetical protein